MTSMVLAGRQSPKPANFSPTLANYVRLGWWRRHKRFLYSLIALTAIVYGISVTLFGSIFFLQLTVPLLVLTLLVIWLLPASDRVPTGMLQKFLLAYLFALLCWPDYLALSLPGLPWITAIRLVGIPLVILLLICTSMSPAMRAQMKDVLSASPWIWKGMVAMTILAFFSIGVSASPGSSISRFFLLVVNWVAIFLVSAFVFQTRGLVTWFARALWGIGFYICVIALWEVRYSRLPWAGRVPSFLKIEDEAVQRILSGAARASTGIYRAQSKFTTSLGLAEFLSFMIPFVVHIAFTTKSVLVRVLASAMIPFTFYIVVKTDSRLGMVGFLLSFMLYLLGWAIVRWRTNRMSLFGPAIVISYPLIFSAFIAATFLIGRLRNAVWGNGAHAASTETREMMYANGIPMVLRNPWGHGIGEGASALGFRNPAGILTIDTYYLAIALELGVIGFFVYFGIFLVAIWQSGKIIFRTKDEETRYLLPIAIVLSNFVVIKSVFSQVENHPLIFMILGIAVALIARAKLEFAKEDETSARRVKSHASQPSGNHNLAAGRMRHRLTPG